MLKRSINAFPWLLALTLFGCGGATIGIGDASDSAVVESGAMDVASADASNVCHANSECPTGQDCVYASAGCGLAGVCATHLLCGRPALPYCGCDGATFLDECEGPTHPWTIMGPCPDAGAADASADASRTCRSGADCGAMEICLFATAGCAQLGVCVRDGGCGRALGPYCGCDGTTFTESCEGPGQRWTAAGACPDAGARDAGNDVVNADSGGGACDPAGRCALGLDCCGSACVNRQNDPLNCGRCGARCEGATPMCSGGTCTAQSCAPVCGPGSVCCAVQHAGPSGPPMCVAGITCPVGCPLCL